MHNSVRMIEILKQLQLIIKKVMIEFQKNLSTKIYVKVLQHMCNKYQSSKVKFKYFSIKSFTLTKFQKPINIE